MKTYKQFTESMLPEPSMARRMMNNPPAPKEPAEDKFKKQYDRHDKEIKVLKDKLKGYQKK